MCFCSQISGVRSAYCGPVTTGISSIHKFDPVSLPEIPYNTAALPAFYYSQIDRAGTRDNPMLGWPHPHLPTQLPWPKRRRAERDLRRISLILIKLNMAYNVHRDTPRFVCCFMAQFLKREKEI